MTDGCVLAFDFGLKHIGVAAGQTITSSASPLTTLAARDGIPDWQHVERLVKEWQPIRLIVGLPLNMDGTESDMSATARQFGARLSEHTGIAVEMVDERLTTRAATDAARHSVSSKGKTSGSHDSAAALIAETWLHEN